jgi:hypothetical protein
VDSLQDRSDNAYDNGARRHGDYHPPVR